MYPCFCCCCDKLTDFDSHFVALWITERDIPTMFRVSERSEWRTACSEWLFKCTLNLLLCALCAHAWWIKKQTKQKKTLEKIPPLAHSDNDNTTAIYSSRCAITRYLMWKKRATTIWEAPASRKIFLCSTKAVHFLHGLKMFLYCHLYTRFVIHSVAR